MERDDALTLVRTLTQPVLELFSPAQLDEFEDDFAAWTLNAGALFDTVGWAVHTWYHRKDAMEQLVRNAMAQRFTWEDATSKYEELYALAVVKRLGEARAHGRVAALRPGSEGETWNGVLG